MPEPTATTTLVSASVVMPVLTAFGVPLGLRADLLIAGFAGSLAAIILLNTVPTTGDTWRALLRVSFRRMAVVFASSLTAGYITPLAMLVANVPESLLLAFAFFVGVYAQRVLGNLVRRYFPAATETGKGEGTP